MIMEICIQSKCFVKLRCKADHLFQFSKKANRLSIPFLYSTFEIIFSLILFTSTYVEPQSFVRRLRIVACNASPSPEYPAIVSLPSQKVTHLSFYPFLFFVSIFSEVYRKKLL